MVKVKVMNIAIIVFNDVEELDAIGPWEVFQTAANFSDKLSCKLISLDGKSVRANKGLVMGVHAAMDQKEFFDMILLPGGQGTRQLIKDKAFQSSLQAYLSKATWITSVCSGSLVYAAMGLLKGRHCTSHHAVTKLLQEIEPEIILQDDQRFVRDGNFVTSAGVSAGIDMALWLVGETHSPKLAKQVQRHIEYYPQPPFADETYML